MTDQIRDDEELVRAITSAHFDGAKQRPSSAAFSGSEVSVSRTEIRSIEWLEEYFGRTLVKMDREPPIRYVGCACLQNRDLQALAEREGKQEELSVRADPVPENDAHAVIVGKVSRGLSRKIRDCSTFVPR